MQINKLKDLITQNKNGAGELIVVEGLHAVKHALRFNAKALTVVCKNKNNLKILTNKLCPDLLDKIEDITIEIGEDFDNLTESKIRTGILGLFYKPKNDLNISDQSAVLLDDPRDLENIGAVVRVVAASGIRNLIVTGDSNPWNVKSIRAGAGLQFALNIFQSKENIRPDILKNISIICFDERGEDLNRSLKKELPKKAIYVFGSERDGISEKLKTKATKIVRLPMRDGVSSLNLATSVAAALYSLK